MANYNLTNQTAVATDNPSVEWKQTTATPFVTPTWASAVRASSSTDTTQNNFNFTKIISFLHKILGKKKSGILIF